MNVLFCCVLIFCVLLFCWLFRRVGLLPDLQQEHEQSIPAGNLTAFRHMAMYQHIRL